MSPCEGVTIMDMGHKMGCNGVDNGQLKFNHVVAPRWAAGPSVCVYLCVYLCVCGGGVCGGGGVVWGAVLLRQVIASPNA